MDGARCWVLAMVHIISTTGNHRTPLRKALGGVQLHAHEEGNEPGRL